MAFGFVNTAVTNILTATGLPDIESKFVQTNNAL